MIDACLFHLVVIGEAVNRIDNHLLEREPDIPWAGIVGLRVIPTPPIRVLVTAGNSLNLGAVLP